MKAYIKGRKVLIAGNGGSAADAQHIACELVSKFYFERQALDAVALTTNSSILTANSNDFDFEQVFSRQIQASGSKGDIFIAISTSGNSKNIIKAVDTARKSGLKVVGFTGALPGAIDEFCDYILKVPSDETPIIQESHIMLAHILCAIIEADFIKK